MSYIAIGNCNKYNIYILISFVCEFFMCFLFGLNSSNKEKPARIFPFRSKIKDHTFLDNFIRIASIFFGGIFLYFFERKGERKKISDMTKEDYESLKMELKRNKVKSTTLILFIIGILFSLYIILKDFISTVNAYVGFWTFEIMYVCIISLYIFKIKIYKHRKIAIIIMLVLAIIEFIGFFLPTTKHENIEKMNELTDKNVFEVIIIKFGVYYIPLLFLANEIIHIQRDYCWIKAKYLMDVIAFPPSKIFLYIGSIGIVIIILFFSIFTYVPCKTFNNIDKIGDIYIDNATGETLKLYKEYCPLKDYDENTKTLYLLYDSLKLLSRDYSNTDKENMLEIFLIIPLYFIFNLVNEVSRLMMVRYTDPNNILIYKNFYYFVKRIIAIIINEGDEQYLTYAQFCILELAELISIISNMIYIEVLELKFCKLDYELKKNISRRSRKDHSESFDFLKMLEEDESEMEQNQSQGVEIESIA